MPHLGWAMYNLLGKSGVAVAFFAMSALFVYFAFGVCYDWPGCKRSEMES